MQRTQFEVFANRMQKRILGPNRREITGGWRKLHVEKLCNLDFSPNIKRLSNQEG
jgi:hypothetical protein